MRSSGLVICILVLSAMTLGVLPANAWSPVYQTGFEAPTFSLGEMEGQDGWSTYPHPSDPPLVTIQNSVVKDGTQAVMIDQLAGFTRTRISPWYDASDQIVSLSVDAYLSAATVHPRWTVMGTYLVDDFIHINIANETGQIYLTTLGPIYHPLEERYVTRGKWNHFEQVLDFGTRTATIYYNGEGLGSSGFGGESTVVRLVGLYG